MYEIRHNGMVNNLISLILFLVFVLSGADNQLTHFWVYSGGIAFFSGIIFLFVFACFGVGHYPFVRKNFIPSHYQVEMAEAINGEPCQLIKVGEYHEGETRDEDTADISFSFEGEEYILEDVGYKMIKEIEKITSNEGCFSFKAELVPNKKRKYQELKVVIV